MHLYRLVRPYLSHHYHLIKAYYFKCRHQYLLRRLHRKQCINVVFFAMNLPMWRYQNLYDKLVSLHSFNVFIVLSPCVSLSEEQQKKDIEGLRAYFNQLGISYIDYDIEHSGKGIDIRNVLKADVLFYPQPYENVLCSEYDCRNFYDKLLGYYPYAFWTVLGNWSYNTFFHNVAWKLYYSTELHRQDAIKYSDNHGKNVSVVGYPTADDFLHSTFKDVWKRQAKKVKRLIWAPHFTISKERSMVVHSNFLWMSDFMLDIAHLYKDRLQIAFKPHPRLLTELYLHPDWGKEKADAYYDKWSNGYNTQLDEGDFKDLFMTSDAMIHDCGSFTVEYHYSLNPVMYILQDWTKYTDTLSDFGKEAMKAHYIGKNKEDILRFIDSVVLGEEDDMYSIRKDFYERYLLPPNGKSVAQNTVDDLLSSLIRYGFRFEE